MFVLNTTAQHHLQNYTNTLEELVKQIMEDLYVDDLITGGDKVADEQILKDTAIQNFKVTYFFLHKRYLNFPELEENNPEQSTTKQTYAKQQLSVKTGETKMLGMKWAKRQTNLTQRYLHQFKK